MAQALSDILDSLNAVYNPQRDVVNQQLSALPGQQTAAMAGLDQAKVNAFSDITSGANARGVLYSGVPIDEQAKYVGSTYLPKVAELQTAGQNQKFALQDSLSKIAQAQSAQAYDILNKQQTLDEQAREATLADQRARSAAASSGGGLDLGSLLGAVAGNGAGAAANQARHPADIAFDLIKQFRSNGMTNKSWGAAANWLKSQGVNVGRGQAGDIALNRYFNAGGFQDYLNALKAEGLA